MHCCDAGNGNEKGINGFILGFGFGVIVVGIGLQHIFQQVTFSLDCIIILEVQLDDRISSLYVANIPGSNAVVFIYFSIASGNCYLS